MTALRKYERLESPGLWRATPQDQRREVIVGLRDATIVLADPKTEMALSQWSLPALLRLNPGQMPALYGTGDDLTETLEVDDRDMIAALDTVRLALERRRPRPGRLRGWTLGSAAVTILAGGVLGSRQADQPHGCRSASCHRVCLGPACPAGSGAADRLSLCCPPGPQRGAKPDGAAVPRSAAPSGGSARRADHTAASARQYHPAARRNAGSDRRAGRGCGVCAG